MKTKEEFNAHNLKVIVKEKYAQIAKQDKSTNEASCCGATACCDEVDYTIFSDDYTKIEGYRPEADLGLGCGIPTDHAGIKKGMHVLDLGSGAGNDCFVASTLVGTEGRVTGLDFTEEMLRKAEQNLTITGLKNIQFIKGDIEQMPLLSASVDVVISNCVLNLVPDKQRAFAEIYRVLRPGGHFCISDVVLKGALPAKLLHEAELYAGCVSGALQKEKYMDIIKEAGFKDMEVKSEKKVSIPDEILGKYLSPEEIEQTKEESKGIISITLSAVK